MTYGLPPRTPDQIGWIQSCLESEISWIRQKLHTVRHFVNDGVPISGHMQYQLGVMADEVSELLDKCDERKEVA